MKISPVASPHAVAPTQTNYQAQQAARAKAMAAFSGGQEQPQQNQQPRQQVVQSQDAVSVEELGAITDTHASGTEQLAAITEATEVPAPTDAPAPKAPVDPALSRQFAQLARQEKQLRAQAQALKAKEAAIAAKEAEFKAPAATPDLSNYIDRNRLAADPLSVLAEAGISYDTLTQQIVNQQPTDPRVMSTISKLEAEIKALKQANEEGRKQYSDNQQQAYQAAVKQIRVDAKQLVYTDPNFETIKVTNSVNDVVELIEETYKQDGILMTVEDAAQQVEDYLVEEATKLAQIDKIQKRLQANRSSTATSQASKQPQSAQQPQQTRTLTNAISSTRKLSTRERAIAAMEGRLK